jgi:hypothetical protein
VFSWHPGAFSDQEEQGALYREKEVRMIADIVGGEDVAKWWAYLHSTKI